MFHRKIYFMVPKAQLPEDASKKTAKLLSQERGADPYGERVYISHIDEWHRVIKLRRLIRTTAAQREQVWAALVTTLSKLYHTDPSNFAALERTVEINQVAYRVKELEVGRELVLHTANANFAKDQIKTAANIKAQNAKSTRAAATPGMSYILRFTLRKNWFTRRVNIMYSDTAISPRALFGLKDSVAKFLYWRNARYNVRVIAQAVREAIATAR